MAKLITRAMAAMMLLAALYGCSSSEKPDKPAAPAGPGKGGAYPAADRNRALPVYERMNYASELRDAQSQPRTVYILEQVSEVPSSEIIY